MKISRLIALCLATTLLMESSASFGQWRREETIDEPVWLDSGPVDNSSAEPLTIELGTLAASSGHWMRVHVADYNLGASSYITLTALDGDVQRLDAKSIPNWESWSAMFNGSEVAVALHVAPGETGVYAKIDKVRSPLRPIGAPNDGQIASLCDESDDRVASTDPRVGRIFGGCTGWLVSNGAVLTAGHCTPLPMNPIIEFNVPASMPNGNSIMAAAIDQYPVVPATLMFEDNGRGQDWMVVGLNPNSAGRQAHLVQGFFYMTKLTPNAGTTLRVTGFGLDNTPEGPGIALCFNGPNNGNPCAKIADCPGGSCLDPDCCDPDGDGTEFSCQYNCSAAAYTQQTSTGPMDDLEGDLIEHDVDTMPGNSGGPIIWDGTEYTFGVHTHGGCDSFWDGYDNHGTHLHRGGLEAALQNFLGPNTIYVDWADVGLPSNGSVYEPLHSVANAVGVVAHGGTIALVPGSYPRAAGNTFTAGADGKAMTFRAPAGLAVIGN
jgi:V8-like Glu-specific endopeptidase